MYRFHISYKGNIHIHFNFVFLCSSLSVCSLIDTLYLCLLHPPWLPPLFCHSGLGIQISLVHREHNSFPHPAVSLRPPFFSPHWLCFFVWLCISFPQHGSQWIPSPCTVCVCSRGSVFCSPHPCPPLTCPGGQSLFTPDGECCPKCARSGGESKVWFKHTVYTYCTSLTFQVDLGVSLFVGFLFICKT